MERINKYLPKDTAIPTADRAGSGGDEDALRESETRYRRLVENSPVGIFSFDTAERITEANRAFFEILGIPSLAEVSKTDALTLSLVVDQGFAEEARNCLRSGKASQSERTHCSRTGPEVYVRAHLVPILSKKGRITGVQGIVEDFTERKKAREFRIQSERLKAERELASGVAHNFNNLLQILMSAARVALVNLESGNPTEALEKLDQIIDCSNFGAEMVKRLQSFARLRSQSLPSEGIVFDLSETVREAVEMSKVWWKTIPAKNGIKVEMVTNLNEGCFVRGSESELFEVVVNLVKNSAEAMPRGGKMKIHTFILGGQIVLQVEDNGVGMSKECLGKVFEPFFTTKGYESVGMGLASSYGILSRHGGRISVHSTEGEGTVFTVKLNLASDNGELSEPASGPGFRHKLRILIVDDMPMVVTILEEGLAEFGQTVVVAFSGEQAIRLFRSDPTDLVICDLGMPGMNGWEVGSRIKALCKDLGIPKPPFILLTGWDDPAKEQERIFESGVDKVVKKPVDIMKLLDIVQELWDAKPNKPPGHRVLI